MVGAVVGDGLFDRVIGPGAGVFQIVNFMSEFFEAEEVLDVVPNDASKRVLTDEPCADNAHRGVIAWEGGG